MKNLDTLNTHLIQLFNMKKSIKMKTKLLLLSILFTQFLVAQNVTFTEVNTPFEGVYRSSIAFADMDHNGTQDVLIAGFSDNGVITKLYISDENGNFSEVSGTPFAGVYDCSIALVSLINDGWHDVIITGNGGSTPITKVYYNYGSLNFDEELENGTESVTNGSVATADVNGDNFPDALITGINSDYEEISKLYTNDGSGNFTEVSDTPFEGVDYSSIAFADVDGDTDQDVLITGNNIEGDVIAKLYTNDGSGNFTEVSDTPFDGVVNGSIAFADVDGDTDQDVLITGLNNEGDVIAKLYLNDLIISTNDLKVDLSIGITSFPNPTALNYINIAFQTTEKAKVFMRVFDMKGNLVLQHNENVEGGQQTIKLNIASLSAGSYFIELNNGKAKARTAFVVQ